ncbi:MAG: hypothetical protein ACD_66C00186G0001 [uncultured bacterium]|uniref:Uncharacterized protein n=1 Tax=Candidatus Uhrbacteria bacterium GW2011_GWC1_41_20 TaxID=1618983 RepID=A0A0G0VG86_9BACT|nr:MAG: hypothetical protein ACD_66C00186G0001 [uncultured bacterium]KKR22414.1 MAG: hypothetical protein UT52_C0014G0005 [Candidatus Uhrbacteria bacterium GW2011_GWE1_39_46]KKR63735.1 MAG: hypothetical protein UU04_C0013G0006 [Candidatus Uhrbacteria bacterium GW2011_GWC2_40_450]KKR88987.1 MAG: hypothetical protein UU36_C0038G0002 [Candidatus Uhrbacteria bacterium GW2011_GWE2_41_1153]KKR89860.1 MAG: hypothetical protein UU40_C0013G0005 [Candidatus Uhrbacteria bacterium GW2011_GWD2_41_121]KKR95
MNKPHGYTIIELIIAFVLIICLSLIVIALTGPSDSFQDAYRNQQVNHVGTYMQALLQLEQEDPDLFQEVILQAQDKKAMIGIGEGCDQLYGSQCAAGEMSGSCLDLQVYMPEVLPDFVYDTADEDFSRARTGYYLLFENSVLEVGACAPSGSDSVRLMSLVR